MRQAIATNPGVSRSELGRLTGLSWGAVAHHLRGMVERGEVRAYRIGERTVYAIEAVSPSLLPLVRQLRSEPQLLSVVRVLNRNGPASVLRISRELGMSRKTVQRHVDALLAAGHVGVAPTRRRRLELRSLPVDLAAALRPGNGNGSHH